MPEKIINLDAHRTQREQRDTADHYERMALAEDALELMDELGVTTRDQLVALLDQLETSAPETPE